MKAYLQIFSMTDHASPLHGRYQGPYQGMNAGRSTSELEGGVLKISSETQFNGEAKTQADFDASSIIMAYRHSDTGVLSGTSEALYTIAQVPWLDIPGLEILSFQEDGTLTVKLWIQEVALSPNRVTRVHFGKTIVYLKNFGLFEKIELTSKTLTMGPTELHAEAVDDDITLAPDTGSALVVKMGQEVEH